MAGHFVDEYSHNEATLIYTETNTPGAGFDCEYALCMKCQCKVNCEPGSCECINYCGPNYTDSLLLQHKFTPNNFVLECNDLCGCGLNCGNRLVQFGPRQNLVVFKSELKGCGLKTQSPIKCGGFICEYAGEVISKAVAKSRATSDAINYIFVLREHYCGSVHETIIDPTRIGNIGRYINHSCHPNSAIVPVRIDSSVPRLAVFAVRDIEESEEITYDYASGHGSSLGPSLCFCGTKECRRFLPFDAELLS